jgi:primosomal protein DnaI
MMQRVKVEIKLSEEQQKARELRVQKMKTDHRVQAFLAANQLDNTVLNQHVQKFDTWCSNLDKCAGCLGLFACKQDTLGHVLELNYDEHFSWELKPCAYLRQEQEKTAHRVFFVQLDASHQMLGAEMSQLLEDPSDASYMRAVKDIPSWIQKPHQGWYFYGSLGSGKSHLAMAILNHFAKQAQKVAFVSIPDLARQFFSTYHQDEFSEAQLSRIKKVPVLVLDDMGAETYSSYFRDEVLFGILNYRMEHRLLTLFTSNFDLEALHHHYRINSKGDDEPVKAARVIQRIQALAQPLAIMGRNRRV